MSRNGPENCINPEVLAGFFSGKAVFVAQGPGDGTMSGVFEQVHTRAEVDGKTCEWETYKVHLIVEDSSGHGGSKEILGWDPGIVVSEIIPEPLRGAVLERARQLSSSKTGI